MFSGTNLPRIGSYNINVVLSSVQASDGISRVEIAQQTGLTAQRFGHSPPTDRAGHRAGERFPPSAGGKPRKTLRINPTAAYAVGIHFDPLGCRSSWWT